MPWREHTIMAERQEFVAIASQEGVNIAELCRRFAIRRKTGYKWLGRVSTDGPSALADRSRRPLSSPRRPAALEARILAGRDAHPAWGGRKLPHWLVQHGHPDAPVPARLPRSWPATGGSPPSPTPPPVAAL